MRVLDPRLYQRARAVRTLLVVDSVLAVVVALLVLAQAFLLARVAARAFGGSSLDDVAPALVLLALVVIARAAGAWGFEVAGRRAAAESSPSCGSTSSTRGSVAAPRLSTGRRPPR